MKNLFLTLFVLIPTFSFADCYEEITKGSYSSRVFRLESHEMEEYEVFDEVAAEKAINLLLKRETSCELKDVRSDFMETNCNVFPHSGVTCEVPTTLGYFIIHRSSYGSFDHSIIYTRWD